jgi:hypothetical protein
MIHAEGLLVKSARADNRVVLLTTYFYDGVRKLRLDVALYQHASSLPQGKADQKFVNKPDLALQLIDQCWERGYRPKTTLIDAGYGNNTPFVKQLESRNLTYIAAAKNRKVTYQLPTTPEPGKHSLEEIAQALPAQYFTRTYATGTKRTAAKSSASSHLGTARRTIAIFSTEVLKSGMQQEANATRCTVIDSSEALFKFL